MTPREKSSGIICKPCEENFVRSNVSQVNSRRPLAEMDENSINRGTNRKGSEIGICKLAKAEQTQRMKMKEKESDIRERLC